MDFNQELRDYDLDEQQAFVRIQAENPTIKTEELNRRVADEFRSRWIALVRGYHSPMEAPQVDRAIQ